MEHSTYITELCALVTSRRYLLLTIAATGIASLGAIQRLHDTSHSDSIPSTRLTAFTIELMSSRLSAVILLHMFLVSMYHTFFLLAQIALGTLRPMELQQTKETLLPFLLLRCQVLISTMGSTTSGQLVELGLLVVWLAALAVLRALLALTSARFQQVLARPTTKSGDLQHLGVVLCIIVMLDVGLTAASSWLGFFSERIEYVPWFEASLMLLRTLELAVRIGFHSLDVSTASMTEEKEVGAGCWENSEFHLVLLQTVLCGCYLVQLVLYYLYIISVDQFHVSLFDLILILNVKNATVQLLEKLKYVKLYHQVMMDLDHLFPDALPNELESVADDVCAICLKPMCTRAKKLRCGHLFHRLCLRQCLQKASVSDSVARLDPLTRMVNGMGRNGSSLRVAGNASVDASSMRCPMCRKQVCGEKCDAITSVQLDNLSRQTETEAVRFREVGQQQLVATNNVQDRAQEQAIIGVNEAVHEEVFRFSTAFLSRWVSFPTFSLEIVRHPAPHTFEVTQEMLQQIWEVFPQYTMEDIRADLIRSRSVERTMERILNGHLDEQRNNDRANMVANGMLGDAIIDLSEDSRWSFTTLASAMWGATSRTPAPVRAPVEVVAAVSHHDNDPGRPNVSVADGLHSHGTEAEPFLRRLQRWRGRRFE